MSLLANSSGSPRAALVAGSLAALVSATACSVDTDVIFSTGGNGTGGDASGPTTTSTTTTSVGGGSTTTGTGGASPDCGNGVLDAGEPCDGANLGTSTCLDFGYSSPGGLACTASCALDSTGCTTTCDGALLEPGEPCDGADLGGATCQDYGYVAEAGLTCAGCALVSAGCSAACGNGVAEPGEGCDGADVGGADCTDFGFVSPAGLACNGGCTAVLTSGCQASCNGTLEPGEVCDGANLNGHDCTDLGFVAPAGLKCSACALDGAGCAAVCGNGTTEPGEQCDDGGTMPGDGCSATCTVEAPTGKTCQSAIPISLALGTVTRTGSTVGGGSHDAASCAANGPDVVYAVTPTASGFLTASLKRGPTDFDSVLYVSSSCADAVNVNAILCADSYDVVTNQALDGGEVVSLRVQQGQTYYLFVDGFSNGSQGAYQLTVDLSDGRTCNDPVPIPLEAGAPMTLLGSNNGAFLTSQGSCGGAPGGHIVYAIERSTTGTLSVDTDAAFTSYNSVLYARSTCNVASTELDCSNLNGNAMESIGPTAAAADTPIFVFVDGSQAGGGNAFGSYGLTVTP